MRRSPHQLAPLHLLPHRSTRDTGAPATSVGIGHYAELRLKTVKRGHDYQVYNTVTIHRGLDDMGHHTLQFGRQVIGNICIMCKPRNILHQT